MSKIDKEQKALQEKQENEVLRRLLSWLGMAFVLEMWIFFVNRFVYNVRPTESEILSFLFYQVLPIMQYGGIILAALVALWHVGAKKKNPETGIFRIVLAAFFAALAVCALLFLRLGEVSVPVLLVVVPSLAGIMMIYYLYQKEFFIISLVCGMGILGLWMFRASSSQHQKLFFAYVAVVLCVLAAIVALSYLSGKGNGRVKLGSRSLEYLGPMTNRNVVYIACALVAVTLLLAMVMGAFGAVIAYYSILVLVIWVFVMAVYFTSKLM